MEKMKGRYKVVLVITISLVFLEIIFTANCCATDLILTEKQRNTKIVDKNGNGDYRNIQDAIDKEPEGTTIYIKSGSYNEIININKKINLIGENKENTAILSESEQNKYSIRLNEPEIIIEKLSIKNNGPGLYTSGIKITASNTKIIDCYIYDTPVGIAIFTSNNVISNCEFYGCTDEAIALLGTSYSECKYNKIINCKFYKNCDGLELQYSSENIITNCEIFNNTHAGINAITSSNDRNIISNCNIYNNNVHGLYISSSSYNKIIDCDIYNNDDGNIVMSKDTVYNEIITNSNTIEELKKENHLEKAIYSLLNKKFNGTIIRIISLLKDKIITVFLKNFIKNDLFFC